MVVHYITWCGPVALLARAGPGGRAWQWDAAFGRCWRWSLPTVDVVAAGTAAGGDAHFSLMVQAPTLAAQQAGVANGRDPAVQLALMTTTAPTRTLIFDAVVQERLFQRYHEVDLILPAAGPWTATVSVNGTAGHGAANFAFVVEPPPRVNWPWSHGAHWRSSLLGTAWARRGAGT
ncbi:MAG: hypothetical protein R2867_26350 [Caldilineaceae bacterium]